MQRAFGRLGIASIAVAGLLAAAPATSAADLPSPFSGNLFGIVVDALGTPQIGAPVQLYDRYHHALRKTFTSSNGRFGFGGLSPSHYSIRVSVTSFLPATRDDIAIRAGLSSVLEVRLASVFSSIQLQYTAPTSIMSDDWKWVLRASSATRAITRAMPQLSKGTSSSPENPEKIFSGTRAQVSLSAGDAGSLLSDVGIADFGTSFALETSVYGANQLTFSGAFGESLSSQLPTMAFRGTYARNNGDGYAAMPEMTLTALQVSLPNRSAYGAAGSQGSPAVRSAAFSYYDTLDTLDRVHLEYGASLETISYSDHLSRASPFARATVSLGRVGTVAAVYSNGGPPNDLYIHQFGEQADLAGMIGALGSLPQFSIRDGHLQLQRTQNYEIGYLKTAGNRSYGASAFYEDVNDGRMNVAGDLSPLISGNLLPDLSTRTSIYNIGRYNRSGFVGSVDQKVNDNLDLAIVAGTLGGFTIAGEPGMRGNDFLNRSLHPIASLNVTSTLPRFGTRIIGNYEYVAGNALVPRHIFASQRLYAEPGLNFLVRQPLPSFFGVGRLELSADLRNLLAEGYIPVAGGDGHQLLLVQAPRAVRGGLDIIF